MRNDTGVYEGGEISIYYDPMIAKLVTHAGDRSSAIEAQAKALDAFVIDGIRHNIPFLAALMQHQRWREGRLSTGFIAEEFPDGFSPLVAEGETQARSPPSRRMSTTSRTCASADFRANARRPSRAFDLKRAVMLGTARVDVEVEPRDGGVDIVFADGRRLSVDSPWTPGEPVWRGEIDEKPIAAQVRPILNGFALVHRGVGVEARVYTHREAALAALMIERKGADQSRALLCPMPGLVKSIAVKEGQQVRAGEPLCVVEAMKMENQLSAERAATVKTIIAKVGEFAGGRRGDHGVRLTRGRRGGRVVGGGRNVL